MNELVINLSPLSDEDVSDDNNPVGEIYSDEDGYMALGEEFNGLQWWLRRVNDKRQGSQWVQQSKLGRRDSACGSMVTDKPM